MSTAGCEASAISRPAKCPVCSKDFTLDTAYKRHVSYCRRAQATRKGRPVSCAACSSSKTKCSFARPRCARCEAKGIDCVYNEAARRIATGSARRGATPRARPSDHVRDDALVLTGSTANPDLGLMEAGRVAAAEPGSLHLDVPLFETCSGHDNLMLDFGAGLADIDLDILPRAHSDWPFILSKPASVESSICQSEEDAALYQLGPLRYSLQQAACPTVELAYEILCCFPQMMLRNQTLPPFMHIPSYNAFLPERISTCRSIARIFDARTEETASFLWRTVDAEVARIDSEIGKMDKCATQQATQCILVYIVMLKVDYDPAMVSRGLRLVQTYWNLTVRYRDLTNPMEFFSTEKTHPSATWEDWIFSETRRRIIAFWFVMRQVMATRLQIGCGIHEHFEELPLISPRSLWEARTREEWEAEKALHDQGDPILTYGELARAKLAPNVASNRKRLGSWEAGTDKLGTLVNLSITLL